MHRPPALWSFLVLVLHCFRHTEAHMRDIASLALEQEPSDETSLLQIQSSLKLSGSGDKLEEIKKKMKEIEKKLKDTVGSPVSEDEGEEAKELKAAEDEEKAKKLREIQAKKEKKMARSLAEKQAKKEAYLKEKIEKKEAFRKAVTEKKKANRKAMLKEKAWKRAAHLKEFKKKQGKVRHEKKKSKIKWCNGGGGLRIPCPGQRLLKKGWCHYGGLRSPCHPGDIRGGAPEKKRKKKYVLRRVKKVKKHKKAKDEVWEDASLLEIQGVDKLKKGDDKPKKPEFKNPKDKEAYEAWVKEQNGELDAWKDMQKKSVATAEAGLKEWKEHALKEATAINKVLQAKSTMTESEPSKKK